MISQIHFRQKTPRTIMTAEALLQELETVRKQGYALDAREVEEHMECGRSADI